MGYMGHVEFILLPQQLLSKNNLEYFIFNKTHISKESRLIGTRCSVQLSSITQLCPHLCNPVDCSMPGFPVHHQLPELAQTHVRRVDVAIQLSHPLSSPSLPAFNLSQHQGLFQGVSSSHQVAKVLEFQLQHQSSNEYSGLISFSMDWLDLLAVQGTLNSLPQYHSSKASTLCSSVFFIV